MEIVHINKDNFKHEVLESPKKVLLDFWAPWCSPCRMLGPVLEKIASEHDEYVIAKVNVDENEELSQMFKISSIPTILIFEGGKVTSSSLGYKNEEQVLDLLSK